MRPRIASAGNITVTNNVILNGQTKQVEFYSYARPTSGYVGAGCPRSTIARNIFSFEATQTDAERTGPTQPDGSKPMWEGGGVRAPPVTEVQIYGLQEQQLLLRSPNRSQMFLGPQIILGGPNRARRYGRWVGYFSRRLPTRPAPARRTRRCAR